MSIQLHLSDATYLRLKANKEENLTKYARSIYQHVKKAEKNRKSKWWESWRTSRKSKNRNREWKTRPISACECLILVFKMFQYSLYLYLAWKKIFILNSC